MMPCASLHSKPVKTCVCDKFFVLVLIPPPRNLDDEDEDEDERLAAAKGRDKLFVPLRCLYRDNLP